MKRLKSFAQDRNGPRARTGKNESTPSIIIVTNSIRANSGDPVSIVLPVSTLGLLVAKD
jgi:hypothetical protein